MFGIMVVLFFFFLRIGTAYVSVRKWNSKVHTLCNFLLVLEIESKDKQSPFFLSKNKN